MKNIYLLPTDKLSRLYYNNKESKLILQGIALEDENKNCKNQHIYITSNEEIKEDRCWVINTMNKKESVPHSKWGDLIIMTTDQELIKDGVQSIDDEFLEWFVHNSSCEFVDVYEVNGKLFAEPIISKEEPKPHSFCETPNEKCTMNYCDENGCQNRIRHLVEPKQEIILKEVVERIFNIPDDKKGDVYFCSNIAHLRKGFRHGAKYQKDRLYTEEDMLKASQYGYEYHQNTNFPDTSWEDNCKNNTRQWLTTLKEQ